MSVRVSMRSMAMLLVWAFSTLASLTVTHAQSFPSTSYDPLLLERLEAAERRIQQLEAAPNARMFPVHAQGNTLDSFHHRLSRLERSWEQGAQAQPKKQVDSAGKPSLKINGRIHLDYWNFTHDSPGIRFFEHSDPMADNFGADPEDRIFFRRIRLNFEGDLFETMLYRMQIDFNTPAIGEMKDMFIGFRELPILGTVRIGNQKRPLGMDHLNSSRFNIFMERPLVIEAFNEDSRRLGIAAYNNTEDLRRNWRYGLYALENPARDGKIIGDSMQLSGNARLACSPWYDEPSGGRGYFQWAVSGMVAKPDGDVGLADTNANESRFRTRAVLRSDARWLDTGPIAGTVWYEILGLEGILNLGPFQVVGEYQSNWMQRDNVTAGTGPDLHFQGGYVHVAYMLTGEHVPLNRKSGTIGRVQPFENFFVVNTCNNGVGRGRGAWQVALRYSYLALSDHDIQGGIESNATFGLVWYFNAYSSLQFNAVYGDIEDRFPVAGFSSGHFTALGMRLRVDF